MRTRSTENVHVVIMAGGKGERFWPASTESAPKQFLKIGSNQSLIRETFERARKITSARNIWVITGEKHAAAVRKDIPELPARNIIGEPARRDTAAVVGLGAVLSGSRGWDAVSIVLPADHKIRDTAGFVKTIRKAIRAATDGSLVTMGIVPDYPATGYGYIEAGARARGQANGVFPVKRFVEKPDLQRAKKFIKRGNFYWNSGMFIWKVSAIMDEIRINLPRLHSALGKIGSSLGKPGWERVLKSSYERLEKVSIDYGVMEKARSVKMTKAGFDWDDVGSWTTAGRFYRRDEGGNVRIGKVYSLGCSDSVFFNYDAAPLGAVGMKNAVVVKNRGAVLVCGKEKTQDVKKLLAEISKVAGNKPWL